MERISVQMTVSLPPELYRRAMRVAKKEVRSKSDLVREALRDYVVKRERFVEARHDLARKLNEKGIRTLEDVDKMIHALRAKKET